MLIPPRLVAPAIALACALSGCSPAADTVAPPADGGDSTATDAGSGAFPIDDAGAVLADAGATTPDGGEPADAGGTDAGAIDAGEPDAGSPEVVTPDGPVTTNARFWKRVFVDDFRGKTGAPDDAHCFDTLKPQCTIWSGDENDCDLAGSNNDLYAPTKENLAAVLKVFDASQPWGSMSVDQVKTAYARLVTERWRHVNKCTWTGYQMLNWMATDYQGRWSARFDASQVTVNPEGKGHLELGATYAPVDFDCPYGGRSFGGPNCQLHAFAAGELRQGVRYTVDPNPQWPGVYYAQVSGACPHGGVPFGPNCRVKEFPQDFLEETGVAFWVDADPRWPGVFYARTPYRCRDNIDYEPVFKFRHLTCPVVNGGVMSNRIGAKGPIDPATGQRGARGRVQLRGRFEAKVKLPKGQGAFPAAWLMPVAGGWPYDGGEIDIVEARDAANEAYQTYHHGKCFDPATNRRVAATDDADCRAKGFRSMNLSRGFTSRERTPDEFWKRDHVFAVEWDERELRYFINDVKTGTIGVGTTATTGAGAPASLATYEADNFPFRAFYWILNHSTYVPPDKLASFQRQVHRIDWVQSFEPCTRQKEFCPCGGAFTEGVGCRLQAGERFSCPAGVSVAAPAGDTYAPACDARRLRCPFGGERVNNVCRVHAFAPGELRRDVLYRVDTNPQTAGVYYERVNGLCAHGGSGTTDCRILSFPPDLLEPGVEYWVDADPRWNALFYEPDFAP